MNVLRAAYDEIKATADSLRESATPFGGGGDSVIDQATAGEIVRLEQLAAALYAAMLTLGVE